MITKKLKLVILILSIFLCLENCNKYCSTSGFSTTSLYGGYTLYNPIKDSMRIGDTLFLNVIVPEKLSYSNSNSIIDFSNADNMIPDISFSSLKSIQSQTGALGSFTLIKQVGSFSVNSLLPDFSVRVEFNEQGGNYSFSFGCIPQKKGIYLISVSDIPDARKKCDHGTISIVSGSSDSHLHYLKDIYYGGSTIAQIDSTHSYCFKVY